MSSKADTLLKKATSFERLSLYSDRKAYLAALAQASLPDIKALINTINTARMDVVKAINTFWRQNTDFPLAAREAYSTLAYPQTDLATAQGEQLTSAMDQFVTSLNSIYRILVNNKEQKFSQFAQQTVYPALDNLEKQVQHFKSATQSVQQLIPQTEESGGVLQLSPQEIKGQPGKTDKNNISLVQTFLNAALKDQIIAGNRGPIGTDGVLGPETISALKEWAKATGIPATNVQTLINAALQKARA